MPTTVTAASDLKTSRRQRGISQQRLAELAGCSLSMVRVLESGYEPETSRVLERVIAVLNDEAPAGNGRQVTTSAGVGDGLATA